MSGPTLVLVTWMAAQEDDADFLGGTGEQQTVLTGAWADQERNGPTVASTICEEYFDDSTWDEWFGMDASDVQVRFQVLSPSSVAGNYAVNLRRLTAATAKRLPDPANAQFGVGA